jgi:hypothetical protein
VLRAIAFRIPTTTDIELNNGRRLAPILKVDGREE